MKTKKVFLTLAVTTGLFIGNAVAADYSFDFLASGYEVSGTFNTADSLNAVNGYDILGISGSVIGVGGGAIDSLVLNPGQPYPTTNYGFIYDNVLFPSAAQVLNVNGVLFTTAGGAIWNLWSNTPTDYQLYSYSPVAVNVHSSNMSLTAVPESETYSMIIAGLGLMGFVVRRRKRQAA